MLCRALRLWLVLQGEIVRHLGAQEVAVDDGLDAWGGRGAEELLAETDGGGERLREEEEEGLVSIRSKGTGRGWREEKKMQGAPR